MDTIIELLKVVLIGAVEGITEWLPVSSTGHMILVDEFVKLNVTHDFWNMFLVVIQLGAILAVCILYFRTLNPLSPSKTSQERKATWNTWGKVILGVIPAAVIGLPLNDWMEEKLYNSWVVAAALVVYGIAFIVIENWKGRNEYKGAHALNADEARASRAASAEIASMEDLSYKRAFAIGCFQVLSLVPGTSRSGSTILGGLLMGTSRTLAAEFSFFMAIPVMFGASLLKFVKFFLKGNVFTSYEWLVLGVGMAVALIVSLLSITFLMKFIKAHDFKPFGVYRIVLGIIVLAYFIVRPLV